MANNIIPPGPNDWNMVGGTLNPGLGADEPSDAQKMIAQGKTSEVLAAVEADKAAIEVREQSVEEKLADLERREQELADREAALQKGQSGGKK